MDESIKIEYSNSSDQEFEKDEHNYNIGMSFGISYHLNTDPLYMAVSWDSQVFPAGLTGGLFLASGRKHAVSLVMGVVH